jgi:hypothetical protein
MTPTFFLVSTVENQTYTELKKKGERIGFFLSFINIEQFCQATPKTA